MRKFKVTVNGTLYNVEVEEEGFRVAPAAPPAPAAAAAPAPAAPPAAPTPPRAAAAAPAAPAAAPAIAAGDTPLSAPMPGKVTEILKKAGDKVGKGETILLLEAMKMQNEIGAPVSGTIKSLHVSRGQAVKAGEIMAVISG